MKGKIIKNINNLNKRVLLIIYGILFVSWAIFFSNTFVRYLGMKAFNNGDYKKARKYFSYIRDKKLVGITYYKENLFEDAFDYYKRADDWDGMGLAYLGMKNYDKAIEYFEKSKNERGRGLALLGQKKYKEALALFEKAGDKSGLGLAYLSMGDLDKAEESFKESSDYFGLGIVLYSKGERFAAIKAFQKSSKDTARAMSYLLKGDLDKARKYFSQKSDMTISGFFNFMIGNYDKASEIYIKDSKNLKKQGIILSKTGEFGEAYDRFSGISDYENLGELFFRLKDYERAFEYFQKSENYKRSFDCLMARGDIDRAISFAKETLEKVIAYPKLRLSLAEIYRQEGKYDLASQEIDKVAKTESYRDLAALYKIRSYFYSKDYNSAAKELKNIEGLYEDKKWKDSISLSNRDMGEISGEKVAESAVKEEVKPEEQKKEKIEEEEEETGTSVFAWIFRIFFALILMAAAGGGIYFFISRRQPGEERASIVTKKESDGVKGKKAAEKIDVAQILGLKDFRFNGVRILMNVLDKQGIQTTAEELLELSGEGEDKLSVYGIYLASRAKGLAVKGIKVEFDYLKEVKSPVIVFFKDETFAHLLAIKDQKILLDFGMEKLLSVNLEEFIKIWNEYVMIFGVS